MIVPSAAIPMTVFEFADGSVWPAYNPYADDATNEQTERALLAEGKRRGADDAGVFRVRLTSDAVCGGDADSEF